MVVTSWLQARLEAADAAGSVHKLGAACKKELRSFNRAIAKNPNANLGLGDPSHALLCAPVAFHTAIVAAISWGQLRQTVLCDTVTLVLLFLSFVARS